jgi:hypothetical protein
MIFGSVVIATARRCFNEFCRMRCWNRRLLVVSVIETNDQAGSFRSNSLMSMINDAVLNHEPIVLDFRNA